MKHMVIRYRYFICVCLIISLNFILQGCATRLENKPNIIRSESPEVSGGAFNKEVSFQVGMTESQVYAELLQELGGDYKDSSQAYTRQSITYSLNGKLGVNKYVDFYVRGAFDKPSSIGVKVQPFGGDSSKSGWKVSTSLEIGLLSGDKNKRANQKSSGVGDEFRKLSVSMYDASVNIGYRYNPNFIVYINNFYSIYNVRGELTRFVEPKYSVKGRAKGFGALVGFRKDFNNSANFTSNSYLTFELGFVNLTWLDTIDHEAAYQDMVKDNSEFDENLIAFGVGWGKSWK